MTSVLVLGLVWDIKLVTIGIIAGDPWDRMERRVLSEEGGTWTVDERRRRIKSAGRQASRISAVEEEFGRTYCRDCLNWSILQ